MTRTLHAIFDGKVLRPKEPVDLEIDRDYVLTISLEENKKIRKEELDPAFNLSALACKTGISDLATEHDHYLYKTVKRSKGVSK